VASIVEAGDGYIRVADQNHRFHKWVGNYSAQLKVVFDDGKYTIQDRDDDNPEHLMIPLGWMTFPGVPNRNPTQHLKLHESHLTKEFDAPSLERVHHCPKARPPAGWLDVNDEAERVFMKKFEIDVSGNYEGEPEVSYYLMNIELWFKCVQAGNQLHRMFMEATEKVLASDDLLDRFALPKELYGRIRRSFVNQRACLMGRFDLAWNGKEMKTYEYNADSAAVLMESAVIQEKWASSRGLGELNQRNAGMRIPMLLEHAWKKTGVTGRVHFCVDDEDEEKYTGLYCASIAKKVGVEPRLCVKFDEFTFREDGKIVDGEGVEVKAVWKTWNWDTAIQDWIKAREERGADFTPTTATKVRLCDLVLGDESIRVFEPLWKYIPANKAILPIVYDAHPNHPNLLRASYTLTDELKASGYAKKPIIGRVGRNITITTSSGSTLAESEGNYGNRDMVYQELFELPCRDGHYGILGGWIMDEQYAGTGVREDTVVITGSESPFSAVRIQMPFKMEPVTRESLEDVDKKDE
jgi:trypanothione synthetase/amidase